MNDNDYKNLFEAFVEFALSAEVRYSMTGIEKRHYIVGCADGQRLRLLQQAFDNQVKHNKEGLMRLRKRVAHLYSYILVSELSTQVVVNVDPQTTFATLVDTPHRNGLLRWAGKQKLLCYGSDLELKPQLRTSNVVQVVF